MIRTRFLAVCGLLCVMASATVLARDLPYTDADMWSEKNADELVALCRKETPALIRQMVAEDKHSELYQATDLDIPDVYDVMRDVGPLAWMISTDYTFKDAQGKKREFVASCLFRHNGTLGFATVSNQP
ncbi:hypothetical protein [Achromobacter sp. Bel]|uniref:hypothetical protein n=1 Tax=Achromobacter sp. Bel TaxID=2727415 RepID=UPI00145E50D3|nr:hypothetical protein [Achromobacter sp. Bel]NMK49516.1 hypothetical protein [Achromobacter sp. Bel]